ncbi:MAG TPA: molybdenum cofactor guanylyltransferase MobA [Acetobacteraceae bacterium]
MSEQDRPVAVLLAGGLARRMGGGDKPLRSLHGRTLLDHVIAAIRPQARALVLNANGDPARFAAWGLPVAADTLPENPGPLAGILAAMRWTRAHHPDAADLLSVPTDTPFLPSDLAARLAAGRGDLPLACAVSGGRTHPVVGLWRVSLADDLETWLRAGGRRIDRWTALHGVAEVTFEGAVDPFFNVNTAEELEVAERIFGWR